MSNTDPVLSDAVGCMVVVVGLLAAMGAIVLVYAMVAGSVS